jgi:hypothetical protein
MGTTTNSVVCCSHITLHQDVIVLSSQTSKPQIPIAIHSPMLHLTLQMGGPKEEKDCPALQCMLDSSALLSTANFHYMEAVIKQYPHILKAIYLPNNYATTVLSGIITTPNEAPVTMELSIGFKIFLPYLSKIITNVICITLLKHALTVYQGQLNCPHSVVNYPTILPISTSKCRLMN